MMAHRVIPGVSGSLMPPPPTGGKSQPSSDVSFDTPIIARSNPYNDLRPFIEYQWRTRETMCKNLFIVDFPHGTNGAGATKEDEDFFLSGHFDARSIKLHGPRPLKQALYAIAVYNHDQANEFVRKWATANADYYENRSMLMGMSGPVAEPRTFFSAEEAVGHGDKFLRYAIRLIRQDPRLLKVQQQQTTQTAGTSSPSGKPVTHDSPNAALPATSPDAPPLTSQEPHRQDSQQTFNVSKSNGAITMANAENSHLDKHAAQSVSAPLVKHRLERQPNDIAPQKNSAPTSRQQYEVQPCKIGLSSQPRQQEQVTQLTAFHVRPQNTAVMQTGPQTRAFHPSPAPMNAQMSPSFFSGPVPGFIPTEANNCPQNWTENHSNIVPRSTGPEYYYLGSDPRQPNAPHNYPPGLQDRSMRVSAPNSTNMDPDSFSRLSNERVGRGNFGQRARRSSFVRPFDQRRSSNQSMEERFRWAGAQEQAGRRFFSDQQQARPPSSIFGSQMGANDRGSMAMTRGTHSGSFSSRNKSSENKGPGARHNMGHGIEPEQLSIPSDRNDIVSLVLNRVPPHVHPEAIRTFLSNFSKVTRVTVVPRTNHAYSDPSSSNTMFVWFTDTNEARRVLARDDLVLDGFSIFLKVPWGKNNPRPNYAPNASQHNARGGHGFGHSPPWSHTPYGPSYPAHLAGPMSMNGHVPAQDTGFNGNVAHSYPLGPSTHTPFFHQHGDQTVNHLVPQPAMPNPKKNSKKKTNNKKGGKSNVNAMVEQGRHQRDGASFSSNVTAVIVMRNSFHASPETTAHRTAPSGSHDSHPRIDMVSEKPWAEQMDAVDSDSIGVKPVSQSANAHSVAEPKPDIEQVSNLVVSDATQQRPRRKIQREESSRDQVADVLPTAPDTDNEIDLDLDGLVDDSSAFSSDLAQDSLTALSSEQTPPRPTSANVNDTTPKANEDVDESFQTAVQTPDSARSSHVAHSESTTGEVKILTPVEESESATTTPVEGNVTVILPKTASDKDHVTVATADALQSSQKVKVSVSAESTGSNIDKVDEKAKPTASKAGTKRLEAIKSGPSKTESLSPFAMKLKKEKAKEKAKGKAQRKARKIGKSDLSGKTGNQAVSSIATGDEHGEVIPVEPSISSQPLETCKDDRKESAAVQAPQVAPTKNILTRILGGALSMASKNEKKDSVPGQVGKAPSQSASIVDEHSQCRLHIEEVQGSLKQTFEAVQVENTEPGPCPSEVVARPAALTIALGHGMMDHLTKSHPRSPTILEMASLSEIGLEPQFGTTTTQPANTETVKKPKKKNKKKKGGKKKAAIPQKEIKVSGRSRSVQDDASSTATLQTHTPDGSRSGSAEPHVLRWLNAGNADPTSYGPGTDLSYRSESNASLDYGTSVTAPYPSVEYSLSKLDSMLTAQDPKSSTEAMMEQNSAYNENVQKSMHKIKELDHKEICKKYTASGEWQKLADQEAYWAQYVAQQPWIRRHEVS